MNFHMKYKSKKKKVYKLKITHNLNKYNLKKKSFINCPF